MGRALRPGTIRMGTRSVRYSDRISARFGARTTLISGLALIAAALVLFTQAPVSGGYASHILPGTMLMGTGAGLAFPALTTIAMTGVTPADLGLAPRLVTPPPPAGGALSPTGPAT